MPDELWMEVHDIVQEAGIKTIPKKKNHKKVKWLSEEDLQIAGKRREVKSKGEMERYSHLNAMGCARPGGPLCAHAGTVPPLWAIL